MHQSSYRGHVSRKNPAPLERGDPRAVDCAPHPTTSVIAEVRLFSEGGHPRFRGIDGASIPPFPLYVFCRRGNKRGKNRETALR